MARFLIEVPHEAEPVACLRAIQVLLATGSHYLTQADFGCKDGEHKSWIIAEAETKEEARRILPPVYRAGARIVGLNKFSVEEVNNLLDHHQASRRETAIHPQGISG
jgi:hypothetical protein